MTTKDTFQWQMSKINLVKYVNSKNLTKAIKLNLTSLHEPSNIYQLIKKIKNRLKILIYGASKNYKIMNCKFSRWISVYFFVVQSLRSPMQQKLEHFYTWWALTLFALSTLRIHFFYFTSQTFPNQRKANVKT